MPRRRRRRRRRVAGTTGRPSTASCAAPTPPVAQAQLRLPRQRCWHGAGLQPSAVPRRLSAAVGARAVGHAPLSCCSFWKGAVRSRPTFVVLSSFYSSSLYMRQQPQPNPSRCIPQGRARASGAARHAPHNKQTPTKNKKVAKARIAERSCRRAAAGEPKGGIFWAARFFSMGSGAARAGSRTGPRFCLEGLGGFGREGGMAGKAPRARARPALCACTYQKDPLQDGSQSVARAANFWCREGGGKGGRKKDQLNDGCAAESQARGARLGTLAVARPAPSARRARAASDGRGVGRARPGGAERLVPASWCRGQAVAHVVGRRPRNVNTSICCGFTCTQF